MERTKLGLSKDKMYKALGDGERTSKKVSMIRKSDGSTFKRKNANQYGTAEGGNDYTEKRSNRTDRFDLGGTADSSNTGANMGGTMGSSVMKHGGSVNGTYLNTISNDKKSKILNNIAKQYGISVKNAEEEVKDADAEMLYEYIANDQHLRMDIYNDFKKNKYNNGGGLSDLPENPNNDAISYKTGGVMDNRMNERTRAVILKIQKTGIHPDDVSPNFVSEIAYDNGIKLKSEEVVFISDNYNKKRSNGGGLSDLPENPNNDAISYKTGGKIESGMIVIGKKGTKNEGKEFSVAYTHPPYPNKITLFSMKDKSMKHFDAEKKDYISKHANGGGLANTPESFPETDAMSYKTGGGTKGYKLTLKSWDADVYEDDYNEGEGKNVNSFNEKVNKSFSSGEELLKYISDFVLYHPLKKEDYSIMDDGRIVTSILVDDDNSSASAREIEDWKNGNRKLYSANYNFYVTLIQEKTPSAEELSKLLGISVYKKGGRLSKYAKGGSTKGFEYTIGGL